MKKKASKMVYHNPFLHHELIRRINQELIRLCEELKTNKVSGEYLVLLYEVLHGIPNHGFDENAVYNIHIKTPYVLVSKCHS